MKIKLIFSKPSDRIDFYCNELLCFNATKKRSFQTKFIVKNGNEEVVLCSKFSLFKTVYSITKDNLDIGGYESFGGMKMNYLLTIENKKYFLYGHKGLRVSIFHNKQQIGFFEKEQKEVKEVFVVNGQANNDIYKFIFFLLGVLFYSQDFLNYNQNTVKYDFGNIGPEEFPFNEDWLPN